MKSGPTASRTRRTISTGSRIRFSNGPPQSSSRLLVWVTRNWLMKYPSEPITSTPSYPASRARTAAVTKSAICFSIPASSSSAGANGEIGDLIGDGPTALGE